eukprot:2271816-Prorocentrum_lima.AAC.1
MAEKLGCALEPRVIMNVLTYAVNNVIITDTVLQITWYARVSQLSLRNPQSMSVVIMFVRTLFGEVK